MIPSSFDLSSEEPDTVALLDDHGATTFADLHAHGRSLLDRLGLTRRERVLVLTRTDAASARDVMGLLSVGAPFVVVSARSPEAERERAIALTAPAWILDESGARPSGVASPAIPDEQACVLTSGTTGAPKIARLGRDALIAAARAHAEALPFRDGDRWLLTLNPARVGGLSILTRCLVGRRTVVAPDVERFDPGDLADRIARQRITHLSVVPTMLLKLLDARVEPGPLRAVLVGGAACPPVLLERARVARWPVLATYGMSETSAQVATQRLGEPASPGVGRPLPGVRVRIAEDGRIEVGGPTLMRGYLGEPPLGEWLTTNDLGRLRDDGTLEVLGRADDRILSGGETIDPAEIEAAMLAHPAVREACVVGVPDATWGELVAATYVGDPLTLDELTEHLSSKLARSKHPRRLVQVDAIPVAESGKPDRRAVRDALARG
ncbi:MAG: class I adenylate-forming enzyme family protein [Sandaracinaceae bacterium]